MFEALRAYAQVAAGLAEPAAAKAREAARALLEAGGAAASGTNVSALTEELLAEARSNRELVLDVVRVEVGQTVGRLGLVDATAAEAMRHRIIALERDVEALVAARTPALSAARRVPARGAATSRAATGTTGTRKKTTTKQAAPGRAATKKAATGRAASKKAATGRAASKKAATGRAATKKAASKKRASAGSSSGSTS